MSGVELAGLVLGVLPLAVSALEQYRESLDPVKAFLGWEKELPHFIRKLRNQHVHYEQTLRQLLSPIATEAELAEMLSKPAHSLWKDEEMAEKLEEKLASAYGAYRHTMADIERIMLKITSKLDLEGANKVDRDVLEAILVAHPARENNKFEFKRRIKFTMSRKRIKQLLEELDICNKELERFTDKSEKLEQYRPNWKASLAAPLQKIQSYANNLHSVLASAWNCSCQASHSTNLRLEQRVIEPKSVQRERRKHTDPSTCFTVSFSSTLPSSWTWQGAEIRITEEAEEDEFTSSNSKVKFSTRPATPPPSYEAATGKSAGTTIAEMKSICSTIHQVRHPNSRLGFSLSKGRLHGPFPIDDLATPTKSTSNCDTVSLSELLVPPLKSGGLPAKMSRKDRYVLSVTLASSILQLYGSPWFRDHWSKDDIVFLRTDVSGNKLPVDLAHPYVQKPHPAKDAAVASAPTTADLFSNKNTPLLVLGLTLLELYFNTSAEAELPIADLQFGQLPTALITLATAQRWVDARHEDLSAAVRGAVAHCLRCYADPSGCLADKVFLQEAVESIVLPLQEELNSFIGNV